MVHSSAIETCAELVANAAFAVTDFVHVASSADVETLPPPLPDSIGRRLLEHFAPASEKVAPGLLLLSRVRRRWPELSLRERTRESPAVKAEVVPHGIGTVGDEALANDRVRVPAIAG